MEHDDNNPYAPPVDVGDEPVIREYDLHEIAHYYNQTTTWGWWFIVVFPIDIFLFFGLFIKEYLFELHDGVIHVVLMGLLLPTHLAFVFLVLFLLYLIIKLSLKLRLKTGFLSIVVLGIITSGWAAIILLPILIRPQARKILESHGVARPKNGLYDLTTIQQKTEY